MDSSCSLILSFLFRRNMILCSFVLVNDCLKKVHVGLRLRGFLRLLSDEGRLRVFGDKPKKAKSCSVRIADGWGIGKGSTPQDIDLQCMGKGHLELTG